MRPFARWELGSRLSRLRDMPGRLIGVPIIVSLCLFVGCSPIGPTGSATPTIPTPTPSQTPTSSSSPSPTAGAIAHPTDSHAVVLREESGGGLVPMEFLLTQAPDFTLYGDGTVIYHQTDTRANDPMGGQGLLPYLVGHLDEDGIQALLAFALGQGRLLNAKPNYENNQVADAGSTTFTLNAAGLAKMVNVYALGMNDGAAPGELADRQGFELLVQQLGTFEQRGKNGELGEIAPYDPAVYRVYLISSEGAPPQVPPIDWPWPDLTPADFKLTDNVNNARNFGNLDKDHVSKLEKTPTGGRSGLYVKASDGTVYSVAIRPLFPDELAAAGLG
jgi:hypothetical protein